MLSVFFLLGHQAGHSLFLIGFPQLAFKTPHSCSFSSLVMPWPCLGHALAMPYQYASLFLLSSWHIILEVLRAPPLFFTNIIDSWLKPSFLSVLLWTYPIWSPYFVLLSDSWPWAQISSCSWLSVIQVGYLRTETVIAPDLNEPTV